VRMPLSSRSIAGVPSSRALPGFPITAHHLVFSPLLCGGKTKNKGLRELDGQSLREWVGVLV